MNTSPQDEQDICVDCGFCCDGTLFNVARLQKDEVLRDDLENLRTTHDGLPFFKLPCPHFNEKCTIYDQSKPQICGQFRCALLKRMESNERTKTEAEMIVKDAKALRDEIVELYRAHFGNSKPFREIYKDSYESEEFEKNPALMVIKFKASLLQIQLSKHFKGPKDFAMYYELTDQTND